MTDRPLSLPRAVVDAGGIAKWNEHPALRQLEKMIGGACVATTVEEALDEVHGIMSLGHQLFAYGYLRELSARAPDLYYSALLGDPAALLPVCYTPTVGEACQKFGMLPFHARGCYVARDHRGRIREVLEEYAAAMLPRGPDGKFECECIVFSDGGRILGLGDLGCWGMGIPMGKLDLYTVCGGFNPHKTIPVMIDAGCGDPSTNSAKLTIRDHELYTGLKTDRLRTTASGVERNEVYYGDESLIGEFLGAARDLFGPTCILQFEDFNSNDAFPLLETYRHTHLSYNDDIQGTASVTVAAILGGVKIQHPSSTDLLGKARQLRILFHGAGSANLGGAQLLLQEAGVPAAQILCTNSRGVIWRSEDGSDGSFKNDEQKAVAAVGKPDYDSADLVSVIRHHKPDVLVGAAGRAPNCFNEAVVREMCAVQEAKGAGGRPIIFALSNPRTQAEVTAEKCYEWSGGKAIFGSGTRFDEVEVDGKVREPGQVNNFFIFPGMSFGAMCAKASTIPEHFFMLAAEAVANSLDSHDIDVESVVPHPSRIREVAQNVATAVVLGAQQKKLAGAHLGDDAAAVKKELASRMWNPAGWQPPPPPPTNQPSFRRNSVSLGSDQLNRDHVPTSHVYHSHH